MSRESLSPSSAARLSLFSPVTSGILCSVSVARCYVGITPAAAWPFACAWTGEPAGDGSSPPIFSEGQKLLKEKGAKAPGAAGMLCCGRRGHPAVTHRPMCQQDGRSQPDGDGRSHGSSLMKKVLATTCPPAKPHSSQPCLNASGAKEEVAASSREQAKPLLFPPAHNPTYLCTPSLVAPFWQPGQPTQQRGSQCFSSSWGSICQSTRPAIHVSICPT